MEEEATGGVVTTRTLHVTLSFGRRDFSNGAHNYNKQ